MISLIYKNKNFVIHIYITLFLISVPLSFFFSLYSSLWFIFLFIFITHIHDCRCRQWVGVGVDVSVPRAVHIKNHNQKNRLLRQYVYMYTYCVYVYILVNSSKRINFDVLLFLLFHTRAHFQSQSAYYMFLH